MVAKADGLHRNVNGEANLVNERPDAVDCSRLINDSSQGGWAGLRRRRVPLRER